MSCLRMINMKIGEREGKLLAKIPLFMLQWAAQPHGY